MSLSFALVLANMFQILLKFTIGGLRPHFYSVCSPERHRAASAATGYHGMYYDTSICKTHKTRELNHAMMSFPSGHSAAAFAGFTFLSLWLNGKLKIFNAKGGTSRIQRDTVQPPQTTTNTSTPTTNILNADKTLQQDSAKGKRTRLWKLALFALPLLFATLVAASKVADRWHH